MKTVISLLLSISLLIVLCACSLITPEDNPSTGNDTYPPVELLEAPLTFDSFSEYERYEKSTKAPSAYYYVPSSLGEDYQLRQITKRDQVYIMLTYTVSSANKAFSAEKLSEYDSERLQTLICRYSLYNDGEAALKNGFIANGYVPVEYKGKTYYRWDEYAQNDSAKMLIGYEIAFLMDGHLIFMHLPAIDTFESMMKYADVSLVNIK